MNTPDAAEIKQQSNLNFDRLGYSEDSKLQRVIDRAAAYVSVVTGQNFDALTEIPPLGSSQLETLLDQAIQLRTEQTVLQSQADHAESAASNEVVQSFTAGLYSESRRDPNGKRVRINTWPELDELLWMVMTPAKIAEWIALLTGEPAPWWGVQEMNWHGLDYSILEWFEPWDTLLPVGAARGV